MNTLKRFYQIAGIGMILSGSVLTGCQDELIESPKTPESTVQDPKNFKTPLLPGQAFVKFKTADTQAVNAVSKELNLSTPLTRSGSSPQLEQVFDISGPYRESMIREGLHLWYKVTFDKTADVYQVIEELKSIENVEIAHGALEIVNSQATYTPLTRAARRVVPNANDGYSDFNDPLLKKQWHFRNLGERKVAYQFEEGSDINLFEAWKKTTGDKRVVVAIIDSGIDATHPDLKGSMWESPQGKHNGKNFVNDSYQIDPGFHGTHVGGTVAARNNNGIGVAGVAGGDGKAESGVRLMSCQIFGKDKANGGTEGTASPENIAKAFIWAAQNGAVLANCSWGYAYNRKEFPNPEVYYNSYKKHGTLIKEGIDYFVKYAGRKNDGVTKREDCLMAGGVILFASGNDSGRDVPIVPACDPAVIAVSSFSVNYKLAPYSNTGDWVDICAPGGDISYDIARGVLSTVPRTFKTTLIGDKTGDAYIYPGEEVDDNNRDLYAFANGTSMATPHVTGIAALMVSHFGAKDPNFTADKLRERLLGAVKARNIHNGDNADLILRNKMGIGYIDAGFALNDPEKEKPADVTTLKNEKIEYYDATVSWTVTADSDSPTKVAHAYDLYLSENELTQLPTQPTATVYTYEAKEGEKLEHQFTGLDSEKNYHVAIQARDRSGNKSNVTRGQFKTLLNNVPQFTNPLTEPIYIPNTRPYYLYTFHVEEKDGHEWTYKVDGLPSGVTVVRKGSDLVMTILVNGKAAAYAFDIVLTDQLKGEHKETIKYAIMSHDSPVVTPRLNDVFFAEGDKALTFNVTDIFQVVSDLNHADMEVSSNDVNVVKAEIADGKLVLTPAKRGTATVTLKINDGYRKTTTGFQVHVTAANGSSVHAIYPLPAHSYLKLLMRGSDTNVGVTVTDLRGEVLIEQMLPVDPVRKEITLAVDRLVPGVYNLIIKTKRATSKRTFIKN